MTALRVKNFEVDMELRSGCMYSMVALGKEVSHLVDAGLEVKMKL